MRSEFAFLFPAAPKASATRKPARKAIKVGSTVRCTIDGNVYTVVERDTRFKSAWFISHEVRGRAPYSIGRDCLEVL